MALITPFHGTYYDRSAVGDLRRVVAPPYDIIDEAEQRALHERHPQNVIRLELGLDEPGDGPGRNRYTRAASALREWLRSGALRRENQPALYYHTIEYVPPGGAPDGPKKMLKGFLATVQLEEFGSGHIYPHENTRAAAKSDRLNLLEACGANFSPIWSLYSDPHGEILGRLEQAVKGTAPRVDFPDDAGFRQRLWAVTDEAVVRHVVNAMKSRPLFIADGHHRYETALNYRRIRREQAGGGTAGPQPYDRVLMLLGALEDPGLTVLPTHRVLTTPIPPVARLRTALQARFEVSEIAYRPAEEAGARRRFIDALRTKGTAAPTFGLAVRGTDAYVLLELKPEHRPIPGGSPRERLDVSILQRYVVAELCPTQLELEAVLYTKDDDEALNWVRQGKGTAALLLNPTKVGDVQAVATAGERMPHKSTYFFPKPLTGLVINVMEG